MVCALKRMGRDVKTGPSTEEAPSTQTTCEDCDPPVTRRQFSHDLETSIEEDVRNK